jgi:hypothetical protein
MSARVEKVNAVVATISVAVFAGLLTAKGFS